MKNSLLLSGLFLGVLFLSPTESQAQWQPDVRLTIDSNNSYTTVNNAWCVAASGSDVHVVWYDNRDGDQEIYYKHSVDAGVSWGADTRLTSSTAASLNPSVSVSGSVVHVVWEDGRDGNFEIYYKRSTDGGTSWGLDTRLTSNSDVSFYPSVSVSGSVVHVVWRDTRDGNYEIYYKQSTDGGISWGFDTRLTSNSAVSYLPTVSASDSVVHVVWYDNRDGNDEIYYKRSADGGITWGSDAPLTSNSAVSQYPSVSVSGSVVHVVWRDYRDGNFEIYYKRSTDGGISWGPDTQLTINSAISELPSVSVSGSVVHVVWRDDRDGNQEIYYKRSTDGGISWGIDTRLTSNSSVKLYSSVSVSDSGVHVVWTDTRDGNYEIYYKRDPTGTVTGIENIGSEFPEAFRLAQNYPNPFNPSTTIEFSLPGRGYVSLKVFNVLGQEMAALVAEELNAGTYATQWDGTAMPSGIYHYRLQTSGHSQTKKLVLLK